MSHELVHESLRIWRQMPPGIPTHHRPSPQRDLAVHERHDAHGVAPNHHGRRNDRDAVPGRRQFDQRLRCGVFQTDPRASRPSFPTWTA